MSRVRLTLSLPLAGVGRIKRLIRPPEIELESETYGDEAITIDGLGADAFRQDTYVWAKDGGRIVFADVSAYQLDDIAKLNRAEAMVRLAVPRLPAAQDGID